MAQDSVLEISPVSASEENALNAAFIEDTSQADSGFETQLCIEPVPSSHRVDHANFEDFIILMFKEFWDSVLSSPVETDCQ